MKNFFKNRLNLRSIIAIITVISVLMSVVCIGTFGSFADAIADVDGDYKYLEVTAKKGQTKGWGIAKSITNTDLGLEKGKSYVLSLSARGASVGGNLFADIYKSTTTSSANKISGVKVNLNANHTDWTSISSDVLTVTNEFAEAKLSIWVNKTGATSDAVVYIDALTFEEYDTATGAVKPNTKNTVDLSLLVGENDGSKIALIDNTPIEAGKDTSADYNDDYMWLNVTVYGKGSGTDNKGGNASAILTNDLLSLREGKNYVFSLYAKGDRLPSGNIWFETYNASNTVTDKVQINLNGGAWGDWTKVDSVSGGAAYGNNYLTMDKSIKVAMWTKNTTNTDVVVNIDALVYAEYDVATGAVVAGTEKLIDLSKLVKTDGAYAKTELVDKTPIEAGKDTSADQGGDYKWLNVTAYGKGSDTDNKGGNASAAITNDVLGLQKGKSYVISLYAKGDKLTNGNIWFETYNTSNTVTDKVQLNLNGGAWGDWTKIDAVGTSNFTDNILTADETVKAAIWVKNTADSDAVVNIDTLVVSEYDTATGAVVAGTEKTIDLSALVNTGGAYGKTELIDNTPPEAGKDTSADQSGDKKWLNVTAYGKGSGADNVGGSASTAITNDVLGLQKGKSYVISLYAKGDKLTNGNIWFETYNSSNTVTDKVQINLNGGVWRDWTKVDAVGTTKFTDSVLTVDQTVKAAIWVKNTTDSDAVVNIDTLVISEYDTAAGAAKAGSEKAIDLSKLVKTDAAYGKTELVDKNPSVPTPPPPAPTPVEAGKDTSADQNGDNTWVNVTVYGKGSGTDNKGGSVSAAITNDLLGLQKGKYYTFSLYAKGDKLTNGNMWFETYNASNTATDKVEISLAGGAWGQWTKIDGKGTAKFTDNVLKMDETVKAAIWAKNTTDSDAVVNIDTLVYSECDAAGNVIAGAEKVINLSKLINLKAAYGKTELVDINPPPEAGKDTSADYDGDAQWLNVTAYGDGKDNKGGIASSNVTNAVIGLESGKAYVFSLYVKGDKLTSNGNIWFETYDADGNATDKVQINLNGGAWRDWTQLNSVSAGDKYPDNYLVMNKTLKSAIWVKNTTDSDVVVNIDALKYAEYDVATGKIIAGTEKTIRLSNYVNLTTSAGKSEYVSSEPITYCRIDNVNFSKFTSVNNAVMKAKGYKNNTAMYFSIPEAGATANAGAKLENLYNGIYTVTAYVKSSGGFTSGHMYANNGMEYTASVKEATPEWTLLEIPYVEVTDGKLQIGFWLKGAKGGEYLWADHIQLKLHGKVNGPVEPYFTKVIDIKNTELSTNANTILASGGYKNATKLSISGTEDYKGNNGFTVKNLEEGTYTLTAYVRSSGGHSLAHMFANSGSDSSTQLTAVYSKWAIEDWTQIELTGIKVSSKGQLLVGFWTNTKANKWVEIDYIQLKKEGFRRSPNTGEALPREAVTFVVFFAVLCVAAVNLNRKRTPC